MSGQIGPYDYHRWLGSKVKLPQSDRISARSRYLPTTVVRFTCDNYPVGKVTRW